MKTKHCKFCEESKSVTEFYKNSNSKDKLSIRCKTCYETNRKIQVSKMERITVTHKVCSVCNIKHPIINFNKYSSSKDGHRSQCNFCRKKYRQKNKKLILNGQYDWVKRNLKHVKEYKKQWEFENKDKLRKLRKKWKEANKELLKLYKKQWYEENKELLWQKNSQKEKIKRKENPKYKFKCNLKSLIHSSFKRCGVKRPNKIDYLEILGLSSWDDVFHYFEGHFNSKNKFTWDNYGYYGWHIDHVVALYFAETQYDVILLNHYTNLQPLQGIDNINKSNKLQDNYQFRLL